MTSLTLAALMQLSMVAAAPASFASYADAHQMTAETGRPLVVLIGADWCPACRTMKSSTIPQVQRKGVLDKVSFAVVDTDREGKVARQMMQGGSIPQLVMYRKTADGWVREALVGGQSPSQVESFIERGLRDSVQDAQ